MRFMLVLFISKRSGQPKDPPVRVRVPAPDAVLEAAVDVCPVPGPGLAQGPV